MAPHECPVHSASRPDCRTPNTLPALTRRALRKYGSTALSLAKDNNHSEVVALLQECLQVGARRRAPPVGLPVQPRRPRHRAVCCRMHPWLQPDREGVLCSLILRTRISTRCAASSPHHPMCSVHALPPPCPTAHPCCPGLQHA